MIRDFAPYIDGRSLPSHTIDSFIVSLEIAYRELMVLELTEQLTLHQIEGTEIVRSCLSTLRAIQDFNQISDVARPSVSPLVTSGVVGMKYPRRT